MRLYSVNAKELREKFLENRSKTSFNYMGMVQIASSDVHEDETSRLYYPNETPGNRFYLNFLEHFTCKGKELFSRVFLNLQDIKKFKWTRLSLEKNGEEAYDDFLVIQNLSHKNDYLTKEENEVIKPLVKELEHLWEKALLIERIATCLDGLKNKYHNQFVKPDTDLPLLLKLVEEYQKLESEAKTDVEKRNVREIMDDLIYFENKVIIPELRIKYPTLFK